MSYNVIKLEEQGAASKFPKLKVEIRPEARRCSYSEAMHSDDKIEVTHSFFALYNELEATCYHECGHAILTHLFDRPIIEVTVYQDFDRGDDGEPRVGVSGWRSHAVRRNQPPFADLVHLPYRAAHFVAGVIAAAGPAAERRFRHERGRALAMRAGASGDDQDITKIGEHLQKRGRSTEAYKRHVWTWAQKAVDMPAVWHAISALSDRLLNDCLCEDDWDGLGDPPQRISTSLGANDVRLACRAVGLRKGEFNRWASRQARRLTNLPPPEGDRRPLGAKHPATPVKTAQNYETFLSCTSPASTRRRPLRRAADTARSRGLTCSSPRSCASTACAFLKRRMVGA